VPKRRIYYAEFRRTLDSDPVRPAYLFTGAEAYLQEEGLRAVLDKVLPPADRSLNLEVLYAGTDVNGQEVRERALTLPFLGSSRVLLVRQVEKWRAADLAALGEYLSRPSASTVLLLSSGEERLKTAPWTQFAERTYHVECYPLFDNQVPEWVERRCRDLGKRIQREAAAALIERTGQALTDLDNELTKLALFVGARDLITEADVLAASGHNRQESLPELAAALGRRDARGAVRVAEGVLAEGLAAPQVLSALAWHFRQLQADRARLDAGEKPEQVFAGIRHPGARRERADQVRGFAAGDFSRVFQELLKVDEWVKGGKPHWELALDLAILRICESGNHQNDGSGVRGR